MTPEKSSSLAKSGRVSWTADLFGDDVRELLGVRARVVSLEPLRLGKSYRRGDREDEAKDRADFIALSRLMEEFDLESDDPTT